MKKRLNLRKKANKYKAEAEALRAELQRARIELAKIRGDGFYSPETIVCEGFVDRDLWRLVGRRADVPEFTIRGRWKQDGPFTDSLYPMYSVRLVCEGGATIDKIGADYILHLIARILSHWVGEK